MRGFGLAARAQSPKGYGRESIIKAMVISG
jgi:hypothetical protein